MGFNKQTLTAIKAAKKACAHMMKYWDKEVPGVRNKCGKSLVTQVDLECEQIILNVLQKEFPTHNYVTEESSPQHNKSDYTWHIDPIDGTHNYVRGLPIFGTSIGCAKGKEVVSGVMLMPALKKLYVAQKGKGAWCNGKRLHVSTKNSLDFSTLFIDGSYTGRAKSIAVQRKMMKGLHSERTWGCAVYNLACVAEGKMDGGFMFDTNSWDMAAGGLLVLEASGKLTTTQGKKWVVDDSSIIISNGNISKKLLKFI